MIPFTYNNLQVRTRVTESGEPMVCLADVARVLGMKNPRIFTQSEWCDKEGVGNYYTPTESGDQEMVFISEPNLYALVMRSTKPEAKAFSRWVTHEVLPAIRKHGAYAVRPQSDPFLTMLEGVKTLYIKQQEFDNRLAVVENRIDAAAESVKALPVGEPVRDLSLRERVRQAINELSVLSGLSHHECWRRVYADYDMITRSKVTVLAQNRNMNKLDYIDAHGRMDTLYGIVRKKLDLATKAS